MLSKIEDEDQRILVKQWLFFKYEKELKRQNKDAPKPAKKVTYRLLTFCQVEDQLRAQNEGDRNRGQRRTNSNGSNMNVSNASGSLMRRPDVKLSQLVDISAL